MKVREKAASGERQDSEGEEMEKRKKIERGEIKGGGDKTNKGQENGRKGEGEREGEMEASRWRQ